jgi:hypothetical protein
MRTITLAAGIVALGTLAAIPFRRTEPLHDDKRLPGIATGPLTSELRSDSYEAADPWKNRPGIDTSLAWQPQPMTFATAKSFEMPSMPDNYPFDSIDLPVPEPVRSRFPAVAEMRDSPGERGLLMPQVAQIEDRFVYTPTPAPPRNSSVTTVQAASVINEESKRVAAPPTRQYIREPE